MTVSTLLRLNKERDAKRDATHKAKVESIAKHLAKLTGMEPQRLGGDPRRGAADDNVILIVKQYNTIPHALGTAIACSSCV